MQDRLRSDSDLFKDIDTIVADCYPEKRHCETHGVKLLVRKTETRNVRSPCYPSIRARKIQLYCPICEKEMNGTGRTGWIHGPTVPMLTRGKSPFSMDMVVSVGKMKFLEHMRRNDIQKELETEYGPYASAGSLSAMGMEFLVRLKCMHMLRSDRIVEDIDGTGYILGIDGTGDGGSDRIFAAMDLLRGWVLLSERIPSEKEEHVTPLLERIKRDLGLPVASVCDMQCAMMNSLAGIMNGVPLRVCDYHFLDDIGCDLMAKQYLEGRRLIIDTRLRAFLARKRKDMYREADRDGLDVSAIARGLREGIVPHGMPVESCIKAQVYDTLSWILRYNEESHGMRFPFVLPYVDFIDRCRKGLEAFTSIRKTAVNGRTSPRYLREIESAVKGTLVDESDAARRLRAVCRSVKSAYALFEELRKLLDIPKDKGDIPRDKLIVRSNERIAEMRRDLERFRDDLRKKTADGTHQNEKVVLEHLDKYWNHLMIENVVVEKDGKAITIEIPRTSSENETCFGRMKSGLRKRLGKKDIGHELNMYGDYLAYVQNLMNEGYVKMALGSLDDLPKAFESIPPEMFAKERGVFKKRMAGYDITKGSSRSQKVLIEDIFRGINAVDKRIDEVRMEEHARPPELYGRQSNGFLTL
jgi:hypothetical protein